MFEQMLLVIFLKLGVTSVKSKQLASLLTHLYNEPHRLYHNSRHIERMLGMLFWLKNSSYGLIAAMPEMSLAIIFHDAVYKPGEKNLEKKSCQLMREHLEPTDSSRPYFEDTLNDVEKLIMLTAKHLTLANKDLPLGGRTLLNLDLLHLADPYPEFVKQQEAVIAEYSTVYRPSIVNTGQRDFLRRLLEKESIFFKTFEWNIDTDVLEAQARSNIKLFLES